MKASIHIVRGPAGAGKTAHLLRQFRERTVAAPGTTLWLAPTRRAVDEVRGQLLTGVQSWWGGRLLTFADFFDEILRVNTPEARPLSGVQRRLLVEEIVARLQETGELSHFDAVRETRGFIEGVLALIAELKRNNVTADQLANALGHDGTVRRKDGQCGRIFAHYEQALRRQRLHDADGRARDAFEELQRGQWQPFAAVRLVYVDGFSDFARVQHDTLRLLAERLDELWISLPDEAGDERQELFNRPRATLQLLQKLSSNLQSEIQNLQSEAGLPAGLSHLRTQLFRPLRRVVTVHDADGVECIAAPGMLGETRLVARRIKTLLQLGTPAEDILVTLRDVQPYADLVREVFAEYDLPIEMDGTEPLTRNAAVAALLRALRLPEDDWPFAGVTALLRNTYFRPQWPEMTDPQRAEQAEVLLRLLAEPRGRDAYLSAVRHWAEKQHPGLEDEQAEESRRRRMHELAQLCGPFLQRFFRAWDDAPGKAPLGEHLAWLRAFADDLGFVRAAASDGQDRAALYRLWDETDAWRERDGGQTILDRRTFLRRVGAIAAEAGLPRTPFGPGRVRVLSANLLPQLHAPYVFVMGLGERSFPRLSVPHSLFDDTERQRLQQAGVALPAGDDALAGEMLLFYQVVTAARRQLVLSYPAVDERGQELLPSSFLSTVLECFHDGAVKTEKRRMLLDDLQTQTLLSTAEYRVRLAAVCWKPDLLTASLPDDLRANLADAKDLMRLRFQEKEHNSYDGRLRHPAVVAQLQQQFGAERIFSPTALEDYVTCPFRFFLGHVLRLEPLQEPSEEIEVTRRGQAVHRALARLHRNLKEQGVHRPGDVADALVLHEIQTAVDEDVYRAPSLASKELWRLEGQRLLRTAARYGGQWQKFLHPWRERDVQPQPHFFEVDFGLPSDDGSVPHPPLLIKADGVEVRVSGRIDRVDVAETAAGVVFWIIDYKTGKATHYTSGDLAEFRRLQLTLYALAVEEVLLRDRQARPLGLAYWLVNAEGPKVVLPARNQVLWLDETKRWRDVRERLQGWVVTLVKNIRQGVFPLHPRSEHCTDRCDFGQICRITQARAVDKKWELPLPVVEG